MVTVAAHQPHFFPWLGYLEKWRQSDVFILLDDVAYTKGDYINRNRIKINGEVRWLTLPLEKQPISTPICKQRLSTDFWQAGQRLTLAQAYPQMPAWCVLKLDTLYGSPSRLLQYWCLQSLTLLQTGYAVDGQPWGMTALASRQQIDPELKGTARLVALCKSMGATAYLSGVGAKAYLEPELFDKAGIELKWQERKPPGDLSALHYLLMGNIAAEEWLRGD